jgi:hypothetical protein
MPVPGVRCHRQTTAVCIGPVTSVWHSETWRLTIDHRAVCGVSPSRCRGPSLPRLYRLPVFPSAIRAEVLAGGRPARSGYPSRPPALAVRPPVPLRRRDMGIEQAGLHGRHSGCRFRQRRSSPIASSLRAVSGRVPKWLVTTSFTLSRPSVLDCAAARAAKPTPQHLANPRIIHHCDSRTTDRRATSVIGAGRAPDRSCILAVVGGGERFSPHV